jgi:hypothetical protein
MTLVENNVMKSYLPIWEKVVNITDVKQREPIIRAGMQDMLKGLNTTGCSKEELAEMTGLEQKAAQNFRTRVKEKAEQVAVIRHLEAAETAPGGNIKYSTYSTLGKYKAWVSHKTAGAKTDAERQIIETGLIRDAVAGLGPKGLDTVIPATHTPQAVVDHFQTRFLQQLNRLASLVKGGDVPEFKTIADAGGHLNHEFIVATYRAYGVRFMGHFELHNPLPYVVTEKEMEKQGTVVGAPEARRSVKVEQFIRKDTGITITPEIQKKFGKAEEAAVNPLLKGLSPLALKIYEDLETTYAAHEPQAAQDILSALEARSKGVVDEETNFLLTNLSKQDALEVLKTLKTLRKQKPSGPEV